MVVCWGYAAVGVVVRGEERDSVVIVVVVGVRNDG
jgi:hypothetical protein